MILPQLTSVLVNVLIKTAQYEVFSSFN